MRGKYPRNSGPSQACQTRAMLVIFSLLAAVVIWSSSRGGDDSVDVAGPIVVRRTRQPPSAFHLPQDDLKVLSKAAESSSNSGVAGDDPSPQKEDGTAVTLQADSSVTRVQFTMSAAMDEAWRKSSKRLTFPISLVLNGETTIAANATFYGKSSLKIKYTKRRSLQIDTVEPVYVSRDAPAMTSFLLLSLWEDKYRIAYRSAIELLKDVGLFFSFARLVELRCNGADDAASPSSKAVCPAGEGRSLGAYLLLEYPSNAITRALREELKRPSQKVCESNANFEARKAILHDLLQQSTSIDIATRNWFYFEKPPIYDVLRVPGYTRDSPLSPHYRQIEQTPLAFAKLSNTSAAAGIQFDMERYAVWVAINAVLQNGDWDDEVFVYSIGKKFLSVMAWDYDNIFMPCHRVQKSIRSQLMFCAETPLEKAILNNPLLMENYLKALRCVLDEVATTEHWESILDNSARELQNILDLSPESLKATFDDRATPPDLTQGKESLSRALAATRGSLESALPAAGGGVRVHNLRPTAAAADLKPTSLHPSAGPSAADIPTLCPEAMLRSEYLALERNVKREFKRQGMVRLDDSARAAFSSGIDIVAPNSSLLHVAVDAPVVLPDAGLYCATGTVKKEGCVGYVVRPFVVRSGTRGSAEFAVPHFNKPDPMSLAREHVPRGAVLAATTPKSWPSSAPSFPVVLSLSTKRGDASEGQQLWLRQNVLVRGAGDDTSMIIRGRSVVQLTNAGGGESSLNAKIDGPLLHAKAQPGSTTSISVADRDSYKSQVEVATPSWPEPGAFVEIDAFLSKTDFTQKPCFVRISASVIVNAGTQVVFGPGCVIEMGPRSSIVVEGILQFLGSDAEPIVVSGSPKADQQWNTIYVRGAHAELDAHHVFFAYSGLKGELVPGTGKHHASSAAITFTDSSSSVIEECYFVFLRGPAFAGGLNGSINVINSVVQWAEMGVECVNCHFASNGSVWTNFPTWDAEYADGDNDAMYLSGGVHIVEHSVIAHTKDDGIDSGSPEKHRGKGGALVVEHSIIEMCQHEGIALSSAPKSIREATIRNTFIQHCQQGLESGYAGRDHLASARDLIIANTAVAIRYGDNYYSRPQDGSLTVSNVVLRDNGVSALNYVRKHANAQEAQRFVFGANVRACTRRVFPNRPDCDFLYPLRRQEVLVADAMPIDEGVAELIAPRAFEPNRS